MAINSRKSGLVQSVVPYVVSQLIEVDANGSSAAITDMFEAAKDPNSPKAIPDVPTTEFPFDGIHCFGVQIIEVP